MRSSDTGEGVAVIRGSSYTISVQGADSGGPTVGGAADPLSDGRSAYWRGARLYFGMA